MQVRGVLRLYVSISYLDLNRENCNLKLISYLMKISNLSTNLVFIY